MSPDVMGGECQESAEVGVTHHPSSHKHQPKVFVVLPPNLDKRNGARVGNRTLNLGIKRRLTFLVRKRQDVSGRASRIRPSDAFVSQHVLACHRQPPVICQISCQLGTSTGAAPAVQVG
jgi:hypothetical protein